MEVILKTAMSLDGNTDDASDQRRVFSSPEDAHAVDVLRASVDAILIGGNTLRNDNPSLTVKDEELRSQRLKRGDTENPRKVIITRRGSFDHESRIFKDCELPPLLCVSGGDVAALSGELRACVELLQIPKGSESVSFLLDHLEKMGVRRLLVEGGTEVISTFFRLGIFSRLRLSVAPLVLADEAAPNWRGLSGILSENLTQLKLEKVEKLGSCSVQHYVNR
jgi:5-amino-6-(5-phosphoribosylamino)uracil reductase